ncbi:rhodanese-like domain-containing protein [Evansella sp. AB-P1]|uniref:rhodanese-like domain-containing protein n=1 Tax=Evansella sp. AB-P1 TaxID=3037653 RepID=UPI00241CE29A|nr:rhodanese-like domain-containing protein [Evansella sp. AB-P1]MDG5789727.1 rhodanese-like domain-containing protein [Evansella sp. AB-P1]
MDIIINILIFGLIALFFINKFVPVKGVNQISIAELKDKLKKKDIQFVDVRTTGEYVNSHIKEFINIPLHELSKDAKQLSKDKEVVVISQSGMRTDTPTAKASGVLRY